MPDATRFTLVMRSSPYNKGLAWGAIFGLAVSGLVFLSGFTLHGLSSYWHDLIQYTGFLFAAIPTFVLAAPLIALDLVPRFESPPLFATATAIVLFYSILGAFAVYLSRKFSVRTVSILVGILIVGVISMSLWMSHEAALRSERIWEDGRRNIPLDCPNC